jgi:ketosteroid isomerase-like protein
MAQMTKSNIELAQEANDAWNRSDWETMEALYWPDAEAVAPKGWPEAEDSLGWEAVLRQFERLKDSWTEEHFELESVEAIDDQRVLQYGRWRAVGKESGIPLDLELWIIAVFRDGKVAKIVFFLERDEAMRAAGR